MPSLSKQAKGCYYLRTFDIAIKLFADLERGMFKVVEDCKMS